jgi:hypothetical protein
MHAPNIPRFVRGRIYRLTANTWRKRTYVAEFRRKHLGRYRFRILADSDEFSKTNSISLSDNFQTYDGKMGWEIEEVHANELPLYLGMNNSKYMEQTIKRITSNEKKIKGRPKPIVSNGL